MALGYATRQAPAGGFTLPQTQRARNTSPMARMAVGTQMGTSPSARIGSTGRTQGQADPMANQFQYSPAQYSQDVESSFDNQLGQNAKEAAMAQQTAENYGMSVQRRNASNAAIGGYSVGGGGFLAGQTNALLSGQANAAQLALGFNKNATDIEARRADYRAGVDKMNTDMANKYAYDDWVYNRGRTDKLADDKAAADSTAFANSITSTVANFQADAKQMGINPNGGVAGEKLSAISNAKTQAEFDAAVAEWRRWSNEYYTLYGKGKGTGKEYYAGAGGAAPYNATAAWQAGNS